MILMHDPAEFCTSLRTKLSNFHRTAPALLATPILYRMANMSEEMSPAHTREPFHGSIPNSRRSESRPSIGTRVIAPEPLCEELYEAVVSAASHSADSMQALRTAVRRFTLTLRGEGAKPEAVLISLKEIINSRIFPLQLSLTRQGNPDELRQQISTWSIQDYFSNQQS
jgi:hypothetical protein